LQSDKPTFRLPMWQRAAHHILEKPARIPLGHGIGSYSIEDGLGPPTWLLDKSPKHSPHNLYLEMLYETGIPGLLLTAILTLLPLFASLKLWAVLSSQQRIAIALYVYYLATSQISGSFAYDYPFQFFLAVAVGTLALKRMSLAETPLGLPPNSSGKSA
jgi:O-antigen ligase